MTTVTLTVPELLILMAAAALVAAILARGPAEMITGWREKGPRLHWRVLRRRIRPSPEGTSAGQHINRVRVARVIEANNRRRQRDARPRPSLKA